MRYGARMRLRSIFAGVVCGTGFPVAVGCSNAAMPDATRALETGVSCTPPDDADVWVDLRAAERGDGSREAPFRTIQAGADRGGRVVVLPGVYRENLLFEEEHAGLEVIGACAEGVVIDGSAGEADAPTIAIAAARGEIGLRHLTISGGRNGGIGVGRGTLVASDLDVRDNLAFGIGVAHSGSSANLTDVTVERTAVGADMASGIAVWEAGSLICQRCVVEYNERVGLAVFNPHTTVEASESRFAYTGNASDAEEAFGVTLLDGAAAVFVDVAVEDNETCGIVVQGAGTVVSVARGRVAGQWAETAVGGADISFGATADFSETLFERNRSRSLLAESAGTVVTITGGVISGTDPAPGVVASAGVEAQSGARIELSQVNIAGNAYAGVWANGGDILLVDGRVSTSRPTSEASGVGGLASLGGTLAVAGTVFTGNAFAQVGVSGDGSTVELENCRLMGGDVGAGPGMVGLIAQSGGRASIRGCTIIADESLALEANDGASIDGENVVISGFHPSATGGGIGALVRGGARLSLRRSRIDAARRNGVFGHEKGTEIVLEDVEISETGGWSADEIGVALVVLNGAHAAVSGCTIRNTAGVALGAAGADARLDVTDTRVEGVTGSAVYSVQPAVQAQTGASIVAYRLGVRDVAGPAFVAMDGGSARCTQCSFTSPSLAGAIASAGRVELVRTDIRDVADDPTIRGAVGVLVSANGVATLDDVVVGATSLAAVWVDGGVLDATDASFAGGGGLRLRDDLILHGNALYVTGGADVSLDGVAITKGAGPVVLLNGSTAALTAIEWSADGLALVQQACSPDVPLAIGWESAPSSVMCSGEDLPTININYSLQPFESDVQSE